MDNTPARIRGCWRRRALINQLFNWTIFNPSSLQNCSFLASFGNGFSLFSTNQVNNFKCTDFG
ncbi:hypothetical protein BC833DRAFT_578390 [Globomyces pollinis-pini]|nr:hypothetical protein BC833DRAFT_578390 [Globomyces pollinis-pini]